MIAPRTKVRRPRDEKGHFFSSRCVDPNCEGELIPDDEWGAGRWLCDGMTTRGEGYALEACTYSHADGDVADYRVFERRLTSKDQTMPKTVDSTSDDRTANNVVRHEYRILSDEEKGQMKRLKDLGLAFIEACDEVGESREMSLAKTNAEQAVMWAVKHVTR